MNARKSRGRHRDEDSQGRIGESQAENAAEQPEDYAFEEQPSRDSFPTGSERGANGKFLTAAFHAYENQVGDIGTGDQQHGTNRAHKHPKNAADIAHYVLLERPQVGRELRFFKKRSAEAFWRRE